MTTRSRRRASILSVAHLEHPPTFTSCSPAACALGVLARVKESLRGRRAPRTCEQGAYTPSDLPTPLDGAYNSPSGLCDVSTWVGSGGEPEDHSARVRCFALRSTNAYGHGSSDARAAFPARCVSHSPREVGMLPMHCTAPTSLHLSRQARSHARGHCSTVDIAVTYLVRTHHPTTPW